MRCYCVRSTENSWRRKFDLGSAYNASLFHCNKKISHSSLLSMPLVENSESEGRCSFRLRRIGAAASFPGISDTFK